MQSTIQEIRNELKDYYPPEEIECFTRIIFRHLFNYTAADLILHHGTVVDRSAKDRIRKIADRLKQYEPIQYILEETTFFDLKIKVNPSVFIPRPETEELVDWILRSVSFSGQTILDIGTGSGCIALALKKNIPESKVFAVDNSEEAVLTARGNARNLNLEVDFFQYNILKLKPLDMKFDLLASNPPYIPDSEKETMLPNVINFEPHASLFVPDHHPLLFYDAIIKFSDIHLKNGGWIFLEFNEVMAEKLENLFSENGFTEKQVRKDINGKFRMFRCRKP